MERDLAKNKKKFLVLKELFFLIYVLQAVDAGGRARVCWYRTGKSALVAVARHLSVSSRTITQDIIPQSFQRIPADRADLSGQRRGTELTKQTVLATHIVR